MRFGGELSGYSHQIRICSLTLKEASAWSGRDARSRVGSFHAFLILTEGLLHVTCFLPKRTWK